MKKCSGCGVLKSKTEFHKNKRRKDGLQNYCKACKKVADRKSNQKHKDRVRERKRKYHKMKMETDSLYVTMKRCRRRTAKAFEVSYWTKTSTTKELLGADYEVVHKHIEDQFVDGMCWENRHLFHIDHIIPLASAKTEEELIKLCHYTNLQPLWQEDNLKKGDKIL